MARELPGHCICRLQTIRESLRTPLWRLPCLDAMQISAMDGRTSGGEERRGEERSEEKRREEKREGDRVSDFLL